MRLATLAALPALVALTVACAPGPAAAPAQRPVGPASASVPVADAGPDPAPGTPVMVPLYPWGADHNGTARMAASQVVTSGGVTTLTAVAEGAPPTVASPYLDCAGGHPLLGYRSGAVHSAEPITVGRSPLTVSVRARAPTGPGTWPAVWLTGADSWPPEIDVMEYLGSATLVQSVYSLVPSDVVHLTLAVADPGDWHAYAARLTPADDGDVTVDFSVDGRPTGTAVARQLGGKRLWLIANLQTESCSGAPGPRTAVLRIRDLHVG